MQFSLLMLLVHTVSSCLKRRVWVQGSVSCRLGSDLQDGLPNATSVCEHPACPPLGLQVPASSLSPHHTAPHCSQRGECSARDLCSCVYLVLVVHWCCCAIFSAGSSLVLLCYVCLQRDKSPKLAKKFNYPNVKKSKFTSMLIPFHVIFFICHFFWVLSPFQLRYKILFSPIVKYIHIHIPFQFLQLTDFILALQRVLFQSVPPSTWRSCWPVQVR